jgi:hypothetical protein
MNNLFQTVKKHVNLTFVFTILWRKITLQTIWRTNSSMNRLRTMVEIIPPPIRTPTISMASTKGRKGSQGMKRGRPEKVDNTPKTATPTVVD